MTKQKGICVECKNEYEYDYNPKYPRKYCPSCSALKKAAYEAQDDMSDPKSYPVVKPGQTKPCEELHIDPNHKPKNNGNTIDRNVLVSYAKDIFCEIYDKDSHNSYRSDMESAINLVKQAIKEFS